MASAFDVLFCKKCLKLPLGAMDSECCHQLFCERCSTRLAECPTCGRRPFLAAPSMIMRGSVFCTLASILNNQQTTRMCAACWAPWRSIASTAAFRWRSARTTSTCCSARAVRVSARRPPVTSRRPTRRGRSSRCTSWAIISSSSMTCSCGRERRCALVVRCTSHYSRNEFKNWKSCVSYNLQYCTYLWNLNEGIVQDFKIYRQFALTF